MSMIFLSKSTIQINNGPIRKLQCHFNSDMQIYEVETRQKIDGIKLLKRDDFLIVV